MAMEIDGVLVLFQVLRSFSLFLFCFIFIFNIIIIPFFSFLLHISYKKNFNISADFCPFIICNQKKTYCQNKLSSI